VERYVSALAPALVRLGAEVTVIGGAEAPMRAALGEVVEYLPASSMRSALRALRTIRAPDVVNTHMSEADMVGLYYLRGRSTRLVSTRHFTAPRGGSFLSRTAFRVLDSRVTADISISECVADAIGGPSTVVLSGVERATVSPSDARSKSVLMVQRLESEKATDVALKAWARTRARTEGWRLRIVGDGSQRAVLEQQTRAMGIADTVEFLGARDDVAALLDDSAIFLAPTPSEAFGLAVAEAMAHGVSVVASASGGHLETVGRVPGATLFPPGDPTAAAEHVDALAGDGLRRIEYAARLQRFQRESLSLERWASETLRVFEDTLR
jgi:glycosyltransferase involved in cell wall biosynthesis